MRFIVLLLCLSSSILSCLAQVDYDGGAGGGSYGDYGGGYDNAPAYEKPRPRRKKASVTASGGGGGGVNLFMTAASGIIGNFVGGWLKRRSMQKKHNKEKKEMLKYIQQIDDVYSQREQQWQKEYQTLYKAYKSMEKDNLERDWDEFKAPDTDGDDKVTKEEYAIYVRKYLQSFPELTEADFPKFDDFDLDADGVVSFAEWQKYLQQQKLKEATKSADKQDDKYAEMLKSLYSKTHDDGTWPKQRSA